MYAYNAYIEKIFNTHHIKCIMSILYDLYGYIIDIQYFIEKTKFQNYGKFQILQFKSCGKPKPKLGVFFMTSYEAQNWDPLYDFENESVLKKSNSSNLFFYISKKNFNILRQSARTIGAARQKQKIPKKSTTVNFDRAPKIFETNNLQAYVIIIKNYCARTYTPARTF